MQESAFPGERRSITCLAVAAAIFVATSAMIILRSAQAAEGCGLQRLVELSMQDNDSFEPVVELPIDDQPRKVELDTGGFWSMLNPKIVGDHRIRPAPLKGWLGLRELPLTKSVHVDSIQIGAAKFNRIEFYVAPDKYLDVDATLGANWLQNFDVEIDPVK